MVIWLIFFEKLVDYFITFSIKLTGWIKDQNIYIVFTFLHFEKQIFLRECGDCRIWSANYASVNQIIATFILLSFLY